MTAVVRVWNIDDAITISADGWLVGAGVLIVKRPDGRPGIHPSWYSSKMANDPKAIVAHYTDTDPGTALAMARNRMNPFRRRLPAHTDADEGKLWDRPASWHISIESTDVESPIVQMAPLNAVAWHAGGAGSKPVPGLGWANNVADGIELVGRGAVFPEAQIANAARVWQAIVKRYGIARRYAMVSHSDLAPHRRKDPGPVWLAPGGPAERVLAHAFA